MSLLDLVILLIAALIYAFGHFSPGVVVIGALLALIVARLIIGERFVRSA